MLGIREKYSKRFSVAIALGVFFSLIVTFAVPVVKEFGLGKADSLLSNYTNDTDDYTGEKDSKKEITEEILDDYFIHYINLTCSGNTSFDLIFPFIVQSSCAMDFEIKSPPPKS